jgi:hypothetical protein
MAYVPLASIFLFFLIDIIQQIFIEISPCSAPWMTALPGGACTLRDFASVIHLLLGAAVIGVGGVVGLVTAFAGEGEARRQAMVCSLVCFVGAFSRLFWSWGYISANF